MTGAKKHNAVFDDVLADLDTIAESKPGRTGARFLKRSTSIGETLAGEREEKVLHWIDPDTCRMWERHNRQYDLLNEENCRDLIDGIKAQGQQEFPAVVRRLSGESHEFEVVCGARRHFAVSWLRSNNYPQFKYLVEVRDLTDEEAFRLADIENRDRDDISDFERARDYASAIELYYGGRQKAMAARLEVSETWLSRYLQLAKLPNPIVRAFPTIRDIKELHARALKPLLVTNDSRRVVLEAALGLARAQEDARKGRGAPVEAGRVVNTLKEAAAKKAPPTTRGLRFKSRGAEPDVRLSRERRATILELPDKLTREGAELALAKVLDHMYGRKP